MNITKESWELHNDYPLAPNKTEMEKRNAVRVSIKDKWFLQCFFFDKEKYAIHYKNIQLYFRLGCKLKKKKHALEFNKSQWLKPCIEFNTHKKTSRIDNKSKLALKLVNMKTNQNYYSQTLIV